MSNFSNASFGGFLKPQSEPAHLLVGGGGWGEVNPMTLNPMALPPLHAHQHGADSISAGRGGANAGALDTVLEGHETPLSSEGEQLQAASLWPLNPSALESAWDEAVMSTSVHLDFLKRSTGIEMPSRPVGLCASPLRIPQNPSYFLLFPAGACLYGHLSLATPTPNGVDALDAVDYFYLTCQTMCTHTAFDNVDGGHAGRRSQRRHARDAHCRLDTPHAAAGSRFLDRTNCRKGAVTTGFQKPCPRLARLVSDK